MTKDEMRFLRRDSINKLLHESSYLKEHGLSNGYTVGYITLFVRMEEVCTYGHELKAYEDFHA